MENPLTLKEDFCVMFEGHWILSRLNTTRLAIFEFITAVELRDTGLLGCDAVSFDEPLPTFRKKLDPSNLAALNFLYAQMK